MVFKVKKLTPIDTSSMQTIGLGLSNLSKYTEDEFAAVASAIQDTDPDPILYVPPPKPRRGTTVYADGTYWNPGNGEGPYFYDGSAYNYMKYNPTVTGWWSAGDAPSDGNLYGRKNGAWSQVVTPAAPVVFNYIAGLTLSTSGPSTTFSVAAGQAADSTNVDMVLLASAISKTTGAWVVGSGSGGLDTGAIAINTWYHVWLIKRTDTGVVDVLVSLSATAPTMPSPYSERRRIGAMKTNASSQWTPFSQYGNDFFWTLGINDSTTFPTTTDTLYTLASVPTGVRVMPFIQVGAASASNTVGFRIRSPDLNASETGLAASAGNSTLNIVANGATVTRGAWTSMALWTNTSAQINIIGDANNSAAGFTVKTEGWHDPRGML